MTRAVSQAEISRAVKALSEAGQVPHAGKAVGHHVANRSRLIGTCQRSLVDENEG